MHKEVEKYLRVKRKLIVLEYARVFGSNLEAYKACGIISCSGKHVEKPVALTTLRRNMINYLNIRTPDHLPCQSELARSGQGVRFFQEYAQYLRRPSKNGYPDGHQSDRLHVRVT